MTLNWLCNFITICAGAYIGTLSANITINRNELKIKKILAQVEEIKNGK